MAFGVNAKKLFVFLGEVKTESEKVTWPGKQEVIITTVVVFALAVIAALFFSIVDTAMYKLVHTIIGG